MSAAVGDRREGGAAALKGLRLLSLERGPDGFGFHMYTNRQLKGQFIKWVSPYGPADLAGMLPGDHVLYVDSENVMECSHHQVVDCIRGGGRFKKILVIDWETEEEMQKRDERIDPSAAIVMIPRAGVKAPPTTPESVNETDSGAPLQLDRMSAAVPVMRGGRRKQVKTRDWKSSVQAYNDL